MDERLGGTGDASGLHVAIIMDGSGRWATARGLPRWEGHRAGMAAVRQVVDVAPRLGISTLTLYAFSCDNWRRPAREVANLMRIFQNYLESMAASATEGGVLLDVLGRRDRLPAALLSAVNAAETASASAPTLHLRLAIDYSGRDAILRASRRLPPGGDWTPETFSRLIADDDHAARPVPDVDLLIRTGGELRLSDCVLWDIAYAELFFTDRLWPDFDTADLEAAVREFHSRQRRFGGVPEVAVR
jgi:undecaprenyl diphosphate synthase